MGQPTHRLAWLSFASILAVCGSLLASLACLGAFGYLVTLGMCDDIKGTLWLWYVLLAYPAYVFGKWARAAWQAGAGTKLDWSIAFAIVAATVTFVVELFEWAARRTGDCSVSESGDGVAYIVGFAFLAAYFIFSKTALRGEHESTRDLDGQ